MPYSGRAVAYDDAVLGSAGRGRLMCAALVAALLVALPASTAAADPPFQSKIYFGDEATEGEYPHQAFVESSIGACGGSLITRTEVLTAAHCTEGLELVPQDFTVRLGSRDLNRTQAFDVAEIDQHDSYNPVTLENDLSILTLGTAVPWRPLRVINTTETALWDPGDIATIVGWGEKEDETFPDILNDAQVPMISDADCDDHYEDGVPPEDYYPATMVCAGSGTSADPDTDTCQGDSGGPLMVDDGAAFALIGVTSWGGECGEGPGVYARVGSDPLNDWVKDRMTAGPPDNDAFAERWAMSGTSDSEFGHFNRDATKETGEPAHAAGNAGGTSLWYRWIAPATGQATIDACTATFDTLLGVYTGAAVDTLAPVASSDEGCASAGGSRAQFAAQQGLAYVFAIDGKDGGAGTFSLQLSLSPAGGGDPGGGGAGGGPATPSQTGPSAQVATGGNDNLRGTAGRNLICGLGGSDLIRGLGGNDVLFGDRCGARGARAAASGDGSDRLVGGTGNDRLFGSGGADRISGDSGNDRLVGGKGRDSLNGGSGRDSINSRDGARDVVTCGGGRDTVRRDRRDRVRGCERVLR
jgi:secreted trypsin-like serine protease